MMLYKTANDIIREVCMCTFNTLAIFRVEPKCHPGNEAQLGTFFSDDVTLFNSSAIFLFRTTFRLVILKGHT